MNSSPILEKDALEAFQTWLGDRPIINIGPFDFPVIDRSNKNQGSSDIPVLEFLSAALKKYGPKSVIYVRITLANVFSHPELASSYSRSHSGVYSGALDRKSVV